MNSLAPIRFFLESACVSRTSWGKTIIILRGRSQRGVPEVFSVDCGTLEEVRAEEPALESQKA